MTARAECPDCGRTVHVLVDGSFRKHQSESRAECISAERLADIERETKRLARAEADCRAIGIGHLWDALASEGNANAEMLREILGSVATYFVETAEPDEAAA